MHRRFFLVAVAWLTGSEGIAFSQSAVTQLTDVVMIAAGKRYSLALKSDGTVYCWGDNAEGQLGDGKRLELERRVPAQVRDLRGVVAIAGSVGHSLALKNNGTVWAWGWNTSGELGNGSNKDSSVPVRVVGLTRVVAIATGDNHSLALKSDGTVWAWGGYTSAEFRNGIRKNTKVPVHVYGLTDVVAITGGIGETLALRSNGTVWSWAADRRYLKQVRGLTGVVAITTRFQHSLALKSDGTIWTWGDNGYGVLGNGNGFNVQPTPPPGLVSTLRGVTAVSGGSFHSLALKADGTVWAWGKNSDGQLGNGSSEANQNINQIPPPAPVRGLTDVVVISGAGDHSLALKNDGTVWAWGNNDAGQLGNGVKESSAVPVQVSAGAGAPAAASVGSVPQLTIHPSNVSFGDTAQGLAVAPQTITVTNKGGATLAIHRVILTGIHPRDFRMSGACLGRRLLPGQSCTIRVTFVPRAKSNRSAAILLIANAPGSPFVVPLSGTNAENPCSYSASPETLAPASPGGIYSFELHTGTTCSWGVSGVPSWFTIGTSSGTGPMTFELNIAHNSGPRRSTTIRINDTPVVISQSGSR